jgi:NADH-quinone oxidoreductase subunit L
METFPLLVPLLIVIPAFGTFVNFFWGAKMGERSAAYVAVAASLFTFIIAVLIYSYLNANHGLAVVIDPLPIFDGWIRVGASEFALNVPWQFRVDTLTGVMLLVVTGVGSLIHIYSVGYIHGDPKAPRFFAFLNLFLGFMLVLVTGNNFLMMFVGWEGVGLCSYLLIGYWWDKKGEIGWQNANAARKAMILNRIGDFGILMAMFLIFWTFGTMNYYSAGEIANPCYQLESAGFTSEACTVEDGEAAAEGEQVTEAVVITDEDGEAAASEEVHHGSVLTQEQLDNSLFSPDQLGVFGQAEYRMGLPEGDPGREVQIGTWTADIKIVLGLILLFMLMGVSGKSAQIPLFVWLPDAMAGPTPVSALIHAATMVTAGVYLLVRSSTLLELVPEARFVVAMIGASTALIAGIIAVGQWDIKRVLAYSTISQLGFMVAAVGVGAYVAAIFHLATHAVFKALLFLGSGSVIHGVEHGHHHVHEHGHHGDEHHDDFDPQDMRNMGSLRGRMPVTFITYLVGTFALSGIPIFAGFWSKDEILVYAFEIGTSGSNTLNVVGAQIVLGLLTVAAGFTAFYMWRQIQMVFFGDPRSEAAAHAPESTGWMTIPLLILAIGAIFVGFINVPNGVGLAWLFPLHGFGHFLESSIPSVTLHPALPFNLPLAAFAVFVVAGGAIFIAHRIYAGNKAVVDRSEHNLGVDPLYKNAALRQLWIAANNRLYSDDIYHAIFLRPYEAIGKFLANVLDWNFWHDYLHDSVIKRGFDTIANLLSNPVDIGLIDGIVNGIGKVVNFFSGRSRSIQTGYVRTYAVALFFGVVVVVVLMLMPLWVNGS